MCITFAGLCGSLKKNYLNYLILRKAVIGTKSSRSFGVEKLLKTFPYVAIQQVASEDWNCP